MSRHYTISPGKFEVEFAPSERATVHGGQLAIAALFEQFELWRKVKAMPLEKSCGELADEFWSKEEETKWRDGRAHIAQYTFVRHQPEGCRKPKAFAWGDQTPRPQAEGRLLRSGRMGGVVEGLSLGAAAALPPVRLP